MDKALPGEEGLMRFRRKRDPVADREVMRERHPGRVITGEGSLASTWLKGRSQWARMTTRGGRRDGAPALRRSNRAARDGVLLAAGGAAGAGRCAGALLHIYGFISHILCPVIFLLPCWSSVDPLSLRSWRRINTDAVLLSGSLSLSFGVCSGPLFKSLDASVWAQALNTLTLCFIIIPAHYDVCVVLPLFHMQRPVSVCVSDHYCLWACFPMSSYILVLCLSLCM